MLGLTYAAAILKVMVLSFLTGGLSGFLGSIDNYPVAIFLN